MSPSDSLCGPNKWKLLGGMANIVRRLVPGISGAEMRLAPLAFCRFKAHRDHGSPGGQMARSRGNGNWQLASFVVRPIWESTTAGRRWADTLQPCCKCTTLLASTKRSYPGSEAQALVWCLLGLMPKNASAATLCSCWNVSHESASSQCDVINETTVSDVQ